MVKFTFDMYLLPNSSYFVKNIDDFFVSPAHSFLSLKLYYLDWWIKAFCARLTTNSVSLEHPLWTYLSLINQNKYVLKLWIFIIWTHDHKFKFKKKRVIGSPTQREHLNISSNYKENMLDCFKRERNLYQRSRIHMEKWE